MTGLREQLETTLGTSYTLDRELGGGGMSHVFLAQETALARWVVVKVLPRDLASAVSVERFKREISLVARLQHPHIVPILSAGETEGLPYFTMPFIEGETLRARLARSGALPIAEALHLLRELASALAYAHRKGVVHRDIKPENILLSEDHALITDFGVAKAISDATVGGADGLTSVGIALGTPAYMAPEQAMADPTTDHRADIYAFGLVAYELLAGQAPFAGRTAQALIAAHVTEIPESIANRRSAIPSPVAAVTMQCLQKQPADRPQRAEEIVRALDAAHTSGEVMARETRPPSIAVLPMVNTSGDADNEHFSDGLTDELIGALSKVRELLVCGRTSAFALKGQGLSVPAIAKILGVANVLEGSVRRAGDRLKVRVQLVDRDGNIGWSEAYDRTVTDVFAVQEDIAQAVVRALEIHLGSARGPLVRPATKDIVAYEYFLKGRAIRRRFTPDDLTRAIAWFEQAIGRDAGYATALAWLSDAHVLSVVMGGQLTDETITRARSSAMEAVALDPKLADGHWALGQVRMCFDWDWPGADREYESALALDPGHVDAMNLHGISLLHQGRFAESLAELEKAVRLDPLLAEAHQTIGRLCLSIGEPERAIGRFREALELSPGFALARSHLGRAYLMLGRHDEALAEFRQGVATGGPRAAAQLAYGCAIVGRRDEALEILRELLLNEKNHSGSAFHIAQVYVALDDADEAFRWLERAASALDPWVTSLKTDSSCVPLRGDPRFGRLLRRLGLAS